MRAATALTASALLVACSHAGSTTSPSPQPQPSGPVRVLMVTATAGFRHDSIPAAREVMTQLAGQTNAFTVTATEDLRTITAATLGSTDVLMFALTSGELAFDAGQKDAIAAFVQNGGGFIGVHSATDTLYTWSDYGRIVGAYFKEHPWTQEAAVRIEDAAHPIAAGVPASFRLLEEFYTFRQNPRSSVHVLLSLDPASVGADGDFPLAWTQTIGRGRTYYNALGHFDGTWHDARFQRQLTNAVAWTAQRN